MTKLLFFVEKSHPLLREIMPKVLDFQDPALHDIISNMRYSITPKQLKEANGAYDSAAGMAANQWGIKKRIFIFTPDGSEPGNKCEIMINPSYLPYQDHTQAQPALVSGFEGCFSIPLTTGLINRYEKIIATYFTPEGKKMERLMEGWEARVFQHETDHLDGKLFDGKLDQFKGPECLKRFIFKDADEMENFWVSMRKANR